MEENQIKFESWALVELFGHNQLAGKVTTETIAGQEFIRIDVPKTESCPEFTKYHLPSAIYGITPVNEEYATKMANKINAQPINDYKHNEVIQQIIKEKLSTLNLQIQ
ncbi:hypothetical protein [Flexithrix dorotheae]|uniref:hypothetical protein n=1 Tax=Flexithrix dorotheae TaxID=70993 RepID=UPI00035C8C6B|nr:hypothetical protein [Flexithrix dorotheae]